MTGSWVHSVCFSDLSFIKSKVRNTININMKLQNSLLGQTTGWSIVDLTGHLSYLLAHEITACLMSS
jgi:hypothetical protein